MKTVFNYKLLMMKMNWLRLIMLLAIFNVQCTLFNVFIQAQGITVKTKDGQTVDYPAENFSHISPYIFSLSSTTYTQGAVATLQYEKTADLNIGRADHQIFASGEGFIVAGGHTTYNVPTSSAELWQNGQWKAVGMTSEHDAGFSVTLADGRVMIGGGYSERGGVGASSMTDIYNPATQTFTSGPSMKTARSNCKAIATSRGIYVSGNLGGTDATYDFYNGTTFTATGNPDGRYRPYLFTDSKGNIYPLSTLDNKGNKIALKKSSAGVVCLYGEKYDATANKDYYYFYNGYIDYMPLTLPADVRSEQYHRTDRNGFLVLTKNAAGDYLLTEPCAEQSTTYNHKEFSIPTHHPVSNEQIEWRGGVYVNNAKNEAYIIGKSLSGGKYTIHIISYNYKEYNWTIASASGFSYDLTTASWTLLNDGRMACAGGYDSNTVQTSVYLFTLPKAGAVSSTSSKSYGVDVYKTDGTSDRYMENELEKITTYKATGGEPGEQQTTIMPKTGGKASLDNITVDMPAGTFSNDTEVTIVKAEKGYIDGNAELSEYYKVKFGDGIRKGFKVGIRMPRLENDEFVRMQSAMMGWAPSYSAEVMSYYYLDVTYVDGVYVAEMPAMEYPDDAGETEIYFGITKCNPFGGSANSRAQANSTGRSDFKLYNKTEESPKVIAMLSKMNEWISEAINKLKELGYRKPEDDVIDCYLVPSGGIWDKVFSGEKNGWCSFSYICKSRTTVNFNYAILSTKSDNENKATVLHELFHYYQQYYDPRVSFRQKFDKLWRGGPLILEEASSTWSEKYYTPLPLGAQENVSVFVPSILPDYKDIVAPSTSSSLGWSERFANIGYGASTLIEYLTQKCGDDILRDIWELRQSKSFYELIDGVFDTKGLIESVANSKGVDIFSQKGYQEFLDALGKGKIYKNLTFPGIIGDRELHDTIGVTSRTISDSRLTYFNNYVYGYGALVEQMEVKRNYNNDVQHGLDGGTGLIEQTVDGLATRVYRLDKGSNYALCGEIRRGYPMKIDPQWFMKTNSGQYATQYFYFVTIADNFKANTERLSRIVARVMKINAPEKKVTVPSSPGTKKVRLETNCYDLKFMTDADWLSCFWSITDTALNMRHEVMPDNIEQRKAIIRIVVPNDAGTDVVLDEIEVTQTKAYIDLSETDIKVGIEGGTKEVSITSTNCTNLNVETKSLFLHPVRNGNTISVRIDPNTSYEEREGNVIVSGIMPATGIKVERFIHFTQAAAPSPDIVNLYDNGQVTVADNRINLPGKTLKYGDYLLYRSADTEVEKNGNRRQEFSWDVKLYIDPKDDKSMRHYEFVSGSVSWLLNRYWTEKDSEGKEIEHQETQRCSYNLKNLITKDGLSFYSGDWDGIDETEFKMSDFVSEYSYQKTLDGKPLETVMQADIANKRVGLWDAWVNLSLADGVPYLEADRDSFSFGGGETFEILKISSNEAVQSVEITTSDSWITIENAGLCYVKVSANKSKATRTGYVYITGTLADGSKLTRTVVVTQIYETVWDEDPTITEGQKAELPTQAILDALQGAGMPLYLGSAPPKLNSVYEMEPLRTIYQTGGDTGGDDYVKSLVLSMTSNSSSPNKALMKYYSHLTTGQNSSAADHYCYLSGDGNSFTLSNIRTVDYEGLFSFTVVTVVSGTIESNSVRNLHFAIVELDDDGSIESMSIGTDGDGISPTTTWEPGEDEF